MPTRIYNHKFEDKDSITSHPIYKLTNKAQLQSYYFITDNISCPVLDQDNLGSCVANASYILFYILSKQNITLSRLTLYYICRALDGSCSTDDTGTYLTTALKSIDQYKLCNEYLWEYNIDNFATLPPAECFIDTYLLNNYTYTRVTQDINDITDCISDGYPIMIGIEIYSSFESSDVDSTGIVPTPNRSKEEFLGGHCMLIVGFDNATQYFKVLNSWGTNWGSSGYCFMSYDYILNPSLTPDLFTVSFTM